MRGQACPARPRGKSLLGSEAASPVPPPSTRTWDPASETWNPAPLTGHPAPAPSTSAAEAGCRLLTTAPSGELFSGRQEAMPTSRSARRRRGPRLPQSRKGQGCPQNNHSVVPPRPQGPHGDFLLAYFLGPSPSPRAPLTLLGGWPGEALGGPAVQPGLSEHRAAPSRGAGSWSGQFAMLCPGQCHSTAPRNSWDTQARGQGKGQRLGAVDLPLRVERESPRAPQQQPEGQRLQAKAQGCVVGP